MSRAKFRPGRTLENLAIGMSEPHCVLLRQCPCLMCGVSPAGTVHHLKSGDARATRGVNLRAPDKFGVPLCWLPCHAGLEEVAGCHEYAIFGARGIADPFKVADDLWNVSLTVPAGERLSVMRALIISAREGFQL